MKNPNDFIDRLWLPRMHRWAQRGLKFVAKDQIEEAVDQELVAEAVEALQTEAGTDNRCARAKSIQSRRNVRVGGRRGEFKYGAAGHVRAGPQTARLCHPCSGLQSIVKTMRKRALPAIIFA